MPSLSDEDLSGFADLAYALADAAGSETLKRFRSPELTTLNKLTAGFDPVTEADKASEAAMRRVLTLNRPEDGVFGEEEARTFGSSGLTWVLDPIDGTRAFISGMPTWGTLIALDDGQRGRIGVIDQPYLQERYFGMPGPQPEAWMEHRGERRTIATRTGVSMSDATLFSTDPYLFESAELEAFTTVRRSVRLTRYGTDCYAYALVAIGQIDAVIESGLQAYDIAAHVPLIEAAGGVVTNWSGGDCRWGGQVVAAGCRQLHDELLKKLAPAATDTGT
ncbi:MAG: inositol monophosphatase family protein [Pseudomonadota bacterium]